MLWPEGRLQLLKCISRGLTDNFFFADRWWDVLFSKAH
jgi:hypothetical protein